MINKRVTVNKEQKEAIEIVDKPLIVIAGPGTGKTTLITEKIDFLISNKGFCEDDILAITFTRKAAGEMSERVEAKTKKVFVAKTFHEFALSLIEEYHKFVPHIDKNYTLIDETAQLLFFLESLDEFKLGSVEVKNNVNLIASELQSAISRLKDFGVSLKDFEKFDVGDVSTKVDLMVAYSKYELYKKKNNFLDFGDLLLYVKELLESKANVREEVRSRYKYVLVDEFQDTNKIQLDILKLISEGDNLTIVGDLKQSIYGFRGANFGNLEEFKRHYSNFSEVFLHENYRSSKSVVESVNRCVLDLSDEKELLDCKSDVDGEVSLVEAKSLSSQFSFIAEKVSKVLDMKGEKRVGILCRRKSELSLVASFIRNLGIKFNANEVTNLFEVEVVKSLILALNIVDNPKEANNEMFKLLFDFGMRGEAVRKVLRASGLREKSIFVLLNDESVFDKSEDFEIAKVVFEKIDKVVKLKNSRASLYNVVREVIFEFNFYKLALLSNNFEAIDSLNQFLKFVSNYLNVYKNNDLERFLRVCEYSKGLEFGLEEGNRKQRVELLTIHGAKGKEFDYVILPFLNERRFPASFKKDKFEVVGQSDKKSFVEEEKRLFFVALSRAKVGCDLVYVKRYDENKFDSKPSEFLDVLGLKRSVYEKEFEDLRLDLKDEVRLEIIEKINSFLIENKFDAAKQKIDLLSNLFGKKSLNSFFVAEGELEFYKKKLAREKVLNVDFNVKSMVYSVSQLKTYEACPKKYLYSYVYKIPSRARHYFDFGTSVHAVLEGIVFEIDKYSKEVLFARGVSSLKKGWISKGYENAAQEREYFEKGILAIKGFIDKELEVKKDGRKVESVERKFVIEVEGKKILGFIDRVDKIGEEFEIIDYKTSNSCESDVELKKNLQLYVYSLAAKQEFGVFPKRMGLWYLIHDKISYVDFADIDFEGLKKRVVELIGGIESLEFSANPSFFNCKYCDYSSICPNSK